MTDKSIEKYQVSQILEHWIDRASRKGQHEKAREYRVLLQFCKGSAPKIWLTSRTQIARDILQKLDLDRQDNIGLANQQVYDYLDPIVCRWEWTPDSQRRF